MFGREMTQAGVAMAQGTTGFFGGRPTPSPVVRLFSFLQEKTGVPVTMDVQGQTSRIAIAPGAPLHAVERLPKVYETLPNGHLGSHQFLVDDFVTACVTGRTPPNNVWQAARYVVPGLIAHDSAVNGGALLDVPDFGAEH